MTAPPGATASAPAWPGAPSEPAGPVDPVGPWRFQLYFRLLLRHLLATRSSPLFFPFFFAQATSEFDVVAAKAPKPWVANAPIATSRQAESASCSGFLVMRAS